MLWRFATWVSPKLHASAEQKQLANDLLWLGLLLGMATLWCFYANLRAGLGVSTLIVTLGALSVLLLGGGVTLERRAVRSGWRPRR